MAFVAATRALTGAAAGIAANNVVTHCTTGTAPTVGAEHARGNHAAVSETCVAWGDHGGLKRYLDAMSATTTVGDRPGLVDWLLRDPRSPSGLTAYAASAV